VFELDGYEEKRNYIHVVWKLKMHENQKITYGTERKVNGWNTR